MNTQSTIYTLWHGAYGLEIFLNSISILDILVDIRRKPQSRYHPHFNRSNLEKELRWKYLFKWDELGGSFEFHNDLLQYIERKGHGSWNNEKLFALISEQERTFIFESKDGEVSNTEKRRSYITNKYLKDYIDPSKRLLAIKTLKEILSAYPNKKIGFFCSEKEKTHCHRYYLLTEDWLKSLWILQVNELHIQTIDRFDEKQLSMDGL